jgi:Lipid desaturase domain
VVLDAPKSLPKWTPAGVPIPNGEAFDAGPFGTGEIAVHLAGGVLNGATIALALRHLVSHPPSRTALPACVAGLGAGIYVADLMSGVLHWAFDTWFDEESRFARRMVLIVREHHVYPQLIFKYPLRQEIGLMSWFGFVVGAPVVLVVVAKKHSTANAATLVGALAFDVLLSLSLELHKCGHSVSPGPAVRTLQRLGLLLSVRHHMRHHAAEHDTNYCIVNGWADATLGRIGFFRWLEGLVEVTVGSAPRENDRRWRRRYGRWVAPVS